jgi:hypothetical protein
MYVIMYSIPYEGDVEVCRGDRAGLVEWFKQRKPNEYPLYDLTIYSLDAPSPEELAEEANA